MLVISKSKINYIFCFYNSNLNYILPVLITRYCKLSLNESFIKKAMLSKCWFEEQIQDKYEIKVILIIKGSKSALLQHIIPPHKDNIRPIIILSEHKSTTYDKDYRKE